MWVYALTDLSGGSIGQIVRPYERKFHPVLNGLPMAQVRFRLDDPLVDAMEAADWDVLLKIWQDGTLRFVGDLLTADEVGGWYRRLVSREGLLNVAYVLPPDFEAGTTEAGEIRTSTDWDSVTARTAMQEVIQTDVQDSQLRQALADAHVAVRKQAREEVTFDPSNPPQDNKPSVMCNFAGGLWRLSKRLLGTPYPSAARSWTTPTPANEIIDAWLNQMNTNSPTKISLGTRDALYATTVGADASYAFKPMSEALTGLQESKVAFPVDDPPAATLLGVDSFTITTGGSGTDPTHTEGSNLHGQANQQGSTWTTYGDATGDFRFPTGFTGQLYRDSVSDTNGRHAILSSPTAQGPTVGRVIWATSQVGLATTQGTYVRHNGSTDASAGGAAAWVKAYANLANNTITVEKKLAGQAAVVLQTYTYPSGSTYTVYPDFYDLILLVDDSGSYTVWQHAFGTALDAPKIIGSDSDLATGGALASGGVGLVDTNGTATGVGRYYDYHSVANFTGAQSFDYEVAPLDIGVGGETDMGELNVRTQIGSSTSAVFEHGAPSPSYGTDFVVGDYVTGRAQVDGEVRFNGTFRIYGVEISIDENGKVSEVPQLVP